MARSLPASDRAAHRALSNAIQRLAEPQHGRITTVCPAPDEPTLPHGSNWRGDHPGLGGSKESAVLASPPISDRVTFAAFAPATIAQLQSFILDVWAHTAAQSKAVVEQASELGRGSKLGVKREVSVTRDTILGVVLEIPTLRIPDPTDSLVWHGEPSNASFIVEVPPDAAHGTHPGRAIITASGIPVTKLIFSLLVSAQAPSTDAAPILEVTSAGRVDWPSAGQAPPLLPTRAAIEPKFWRASRVCTKFDRS